VIELMLKKVHPSCSFKKIVNFCLYPYFSHEIFFQFGDYEKKIFLRPFYYIIQDDWQNLLLYKLGRNKLLKIISEF